MSFSGVISIIPTTEEWLDWASNTKLSRVHPTVVEFLRDNKELAENNRRIWAAYGTSLLMMAEDATCQKTIGIKDIFDIGWAARAVGHKLAIEFHNWRKKKKESGTNQEKAALPIKIIHEESFTARTNQDIPDFLILKAHENGESWVRRNTRAWPDDKKLSTIATSVVNEKFPRETIHTIKWFWENKDV